MRIVVDLSSRRLRAYDDGHLRMSVRVAIGAPASPTPLGTFFLRERVRVTDGATSPYGPWALGLNGFSRHRTSWAGGGQLAIHGTNAPTLIGQKVSNGCVRLRNPDINASTVSSTSAPPYASALKGSGPLRSRS